MNTELLPIKDILLVEDDPQDVDSRWPGWRSAIGPGSAVVLDGGRRWIILDEIPPSHLALGR